MQSKTDLMKYFFRLIIRYPFSTLLVLAIWVVCLMPVPETPLKGLSLIDKWAHIAMYFVLGIVIWIEYLCKHKRANRRRVVMLAWLVPLLMSGLIEIVQATCTNGVRSGDWVDFIANAMGCTLSLIIGILLAKMLAKW